MLREMLSINSREHITVYFLACLANLLLSIPQFQAVSEALEPGIRPQGSTGVLTSQYGSGSGLLFNSVIGALLFQGVMGILTIGVSISASARNRWKWQYSMTSILAASYLGYNLGG